MALAQTTSYGNFVLWIETDVPGTYENVCGLTSRGIDRSTAMQRTEVPYCGVGEEDLPAVVEVSPQAKEVSISGAGLMSQQSHLKMWNWWNGGASKNIRIERVGAIAGEIRYENGAGFLSKYSNAAAKGDKVSADIEIAINGSTTITLVP